MKLLVIWVWMTSYGQWIPTQIQLHPDPEACAQQAHNLREQYARMNGNPRPERMRVRVSCE